jgi:uncharacterized protein (UPF0332 family)
LILKSNLNTSLVLSHINKLTHYITFLETIDNEFNDWKIVVMYYTLYHGFLALVENKSFTSKNHNATIIFILKYYIDFDDNKLQLLDDLQISKKNAEFYTQLKFDRTTASYSTNTNFSDIKSKNFDS